MPSDFGDESGEALVEWASRVAGLSGDVAARRMALRLAASLERARDRASGGPEAPGEAAGAPWARLDMEDFRELEGYGQVRAAIDAKLTAAQVRHEFFSDGEAGREYLLFPVADAGRVSRAFDELAAKAREVDGGGPGGGSRDARPLEERAAQARDAAAAIEASRGQRERALEVAERTVAR